MTESTTRSVTEKSFKCPHCSALASQQWLNVWARPTKGNSIAVDPVQWILNGRQELDNIKLIMDRPIFESQDDFNFLAAMNVFMSQCYSCEKYALWKGNNIVFPTVETQHLPNQDLLDDIKADFLEAASIVDRSPRGAAALLRLCVQKICRQVGEKGKNINSDVQSMVAKGLDKRIQKALDIVRVTGNEAVHPGELDIKDDTVTALKLFDLVNLIADHLITQPKNLNEMFEDLPNDKKKGIAARDKARKT